MSVREGTLKGEGEEEGTGTMIGSVKGGGCKRIKNRRVRGTVGDLPIVTSC